MRREICSKESKKQEQGRKGLDHEEALLDYQEQLMKEERKRLAKSSCNIPHRSQGSNIANVFEDMLKNFDREDLDKLWSLVQERYSSSGFTEDKEIEL
ncbi:hypothetical protein Tco_0156511 [Tanacetum coccineum]